MGEVYRCRLDYINLLLEGFKKQERKNPSPPGHRRTVTRNQISYQ